MAASNSPRGSRAPRPGSRAIGGEDRKKRGGLLWLLLGLLAILVVLLIVGLVSCGGDDSKDSAATTTAGTATATPAPAPAATPAPAAAAGTLTAGGTSLIDGRDFTSEVDSPATGTGLQVLSTTKGGFVVGKAGTDPTSPEAVFVEYGSKVGGDEAGSTYEGKVGDTVDLTGPVKAAPENPGRTLELEAPEAKLVKAQGAYVNADTVKKTG